MTVRELTASTAPRTIRLALWRRGTPSWWVQLALVSCGSLTFLVGGLFVLFIAPSPRTQLVGAVIAPLGAVLVVGCCWLIWIASSPQANAVELTSAAILVPRFGSWGVLDQADRGLAWTEVRMAGVIETVEDIALLPAVANRTHVPGAPGSQNPATEDPSAPPKGSDLPALATEANDGRVFVFARVRDQGPGPP